MTSTGGRFLSQLHSYQYDWLVTSVHYVIVGIPIKLVGGGFKLWIQIDEANFTDLMSFLPSNLVKISPNPEVLSSKT